MIASPDPDSLLVPARDGRLIQYFELGTNTTMLKLYYYPLPSMPCDVNQYYVRKYTYEAIMSAEDEEDVQAISGTSELSFPWTHNITYIRVFAISNADNSSCGKMDYFTRLLCYGTSTLPVCMTS